MRTAKTLILGIIAAFGFALAVVGFVSAVIEAGTVRLGLAVLGLAIVSGVGYIFAAWEKKP